MDNDGISRHHKRRIISSNHYQQNKTSSRHRTNRFLFLLFCEHACLLEDVLIGLEYESMDGIRFIASQKQLAPLTQHKDPVSIFLQQDIPLFLPPPSDTWLAESPADTSGKRPKGLCQLQRIYFSTPGAPATLATRPRIVFRSTSNDVSFAAEFHLSAPVMLPSDCLCILRLPFIYGVPAEWTGAQGIEDRIDNKLDKAQCWMPFVQTQETHPYTAVLQKNSLLFPV